MSRLSLLILDDREGLIARSPGLARMRELADVRVLAGSLDELGADELERVQVLMAVRERTKLDTAVMASALSRQLRGVADEFLLKVNRDRPEHLEAILAPSIIPTE